MSKFKDTITWDSLERLNKIVGYLTSAANEIDEFATNIIDCGKISQIIQEKQNVTLWKLRDCFDEMIKIYSEELKLAQEFKKYLDEN